MKNYRLDMPPNVLVDEDLRWFPAQLVFNPLHVAKLIRDTAATVSSMWETGNHRSDYPIAVGSINDKGVKLSVVCSWQDGTTVLVVDSDDDLRTALLPAVSEDIGVTFYVKTRPPQLLYAGLFYPGVMAHVDCGDVFDHGHEDALMAFSYIKEA